MNIIQINANIYNLLIENIHNNGKDKMLICLTDNCCR